MTDWSCEALRVELGGSVILHGVSLHGAAGSSTAVVGPSGAGKTTLLRVLAGLTRAEHGTVRIDGRDVTGIPAHRRGIAVMFSDARLFGSMDVGDNVAFALRMRRVAAAERRRRAEQLLADVGLDGFATRSPRSLSGGEQQRVALARALAAEPRLLLLDEPTSSVDPPRRAELRRLLRSVQRRHALTTIAVTHDQAEAAELADQLVVLLAGEVAQVGTPRAVYENPASCAVAGFLGAHNVLHVEVCEGRGRLAGVGVPVRGGDGPASLAIRPEQVRIDPHGAWRLRVEDVAFCGSHERVELGHEGLRLSVHVPVGTAPPTGSMVGVDLPLDALWVMPRAIDA